MARVTITEAAKLASTSRKTIYAHIKKGKLTSSLDKDGVRKIDTSELVRVYDVTLPSNSKVTPKVTDKVTSGNVTGNTINLTSEQLELIIEKAVEKALLKVVPVLLEHKEPVRNTDTDTNIRTKKSTPVDTEPKKPAINDYLDDMSFIGKK
jgi:hypothetical protein